ncbi:hypothetical protein HEP81_03765 [Streptomyces griseofuscus]|uniref:Uncharacterized protein n=1 Tax=Streptomyces griseofuscus TaxID=146922 RepID=A0A7H1Q183_9ACTN|nr:hypothetical protein HEP81_03765 [Streptomyces griseofuscus]
MVAVEPVDGHGRQEAALDRTGAFVDRLLLGADPGLDPLGQAEGHGVGTRIGGRAHAPHGVVPVLDPAQVDVVGGVRAGVVHEGAEVLRGQARHERRRWEGQYEAECRAAAEDTGQPVKGLRDALRQRMGIGIGVVLHVLVPGHRPHQLPRAREVGHGQVDQRYLVGERVLLRVPAEAGGGEDGVAVVVARSRAAGPRVLAGGHHVLVDVVHHPVSVAHGRELHLALGELRLHEEPDRQRERRNVAELPERVRLVPPADIHAAPPR